MTRKHMMRRGDTIIEVIMAVTVFSLVAVGAIALMNSGISMAQRSLEMTLVRQQIDAQAEMLRFVADHAKQGDPGLRKLWEDITLSSLSSSGAPKLLLGIDACPALTTGFVLRGDPAGKIVKSNIVAGTGTYQSSPATYARVAATQSEGVSIQLKKVANNRAYDAYIQACWYGPGQSRPMTTGTIVRIYDEKA